MTKTDYLPLEEDFEIQYVRPEAKNLYENGFPQPATPFSAGCDLAACLMEREIFLEKGARIKIPTGLAIQPLKRGLAGFIYSRSGLGAKDGLIVAQGVGLVDPDYTGEIFVFILNTCGEKRTISHGQRIAQLVIQPFVRPKWRQVAKLAKTERGAGGFGHTGI